MLISHARAVPPGVQRRRERGLLAAAALGETHLHVSSLAGEVAALGAFHRAPSATQDVWRRHTGGRAVACGNGFLVASLALPHRSALVATDRQALAPEQVMNRCVRGVMGALRSLGVDPTYPGLDLLTHARRALAHLSFVEVEGGATLFQAIVAIDESLARTAHLLDRLDPEGRVPITMLSGAEATTLREQLPAARQGMRLDPPAFVDLLATGYREAFGVLPAELDPEVTDVLAAGYADEPDPVHLPAMPEAAASARTMGLLGPIEAWMETRDGTIRAASLTGDFIAPDWLVEKLDRSLRGRSVTRDDIAHAVELLLDGSEGYLLGLKQSELVELLASAAGLAR